VSAAITRVLERLSKAGFQTRCGSITPFGETLAVVSGVAWDTTTSQLALIAELDAQADTEAWRQLLFAGSGIRHQLAGAGPAAYGTPVILAIVDEQGERIMRALAEELAENYALFSRLEVNLIRRADLSEDQRLDLALAPLLPCARRLLGQAISRNEVKRFWQTLRGEINKAARALDDVFAEHREEAAEQCAQILIGDSADAPELPAPAPIDRVEIDNFRSFEHAVVELADVSVIHGPNGSGKSSIIEALELVWAARSQRQPPGVSAAEYNRHLPREGSGEFHVNAAGQSIGVAGDVQTGETARCVLAQESIASLVASSPADRYLQLLATTGLEIPDLKTRTGELIDETYNQVTAALSAAGLPQLRGRGSDAKKLLVTELSRGISVRLPQTVELNALERTLAEVSAGSYDQHVWEDRDARSALAEADTALTRALVTPDDPSLPEALDAAKVALERLASAREATAQSAQRLLQELRRMIAPVRDDVRVGTPKDAPASPEMPPALAVRWLAHSRSIEEAAARFRADAEQLPSARWANRLNAYADALHAASAAVPQDALEPLTRSAPTPAPRRSTPELVVPLELYREAGFTRVPEKPESILDALGELAAELQRHAGILQRLAAETSEHPARHFAQHSQRVLGAICRFELARNLRREGPVMRASETLVGELLQDRVAPLLRELVAATVRFEWYFKPLEIPEQTRKLTFGGLSTSQPDLDARLTLNSAERHVVGVAWFLALHLLQPAERRRVLVLDDPTSGFDTVNRGGFIATLRAFARLTRPEQLIIVTQDDTLAAVLAEEFASVDGWPGTVTRVRCSRDACDRSTTNVHPCPSAAHTTHEETDMLGIAREPTLQA
jgi:energy-coupling factor transporter ATP-binding protein EcfA2